MPLETYTTIYHTHLAADDDATHVLSFLLDLGITPDHAYRIMAIVGELTDNVFAHNLGYAPVCNLGITRDGQSLVIVVSDTGAGFYTSLQHIPQKPMSEIEALQLALQPHISSRVGEKRGNGLPLVRTWVKDHYHGYIQIQSRQGNIFIENDTRISYENISIVGSQITCFLMLP